MPDRIDTFDRDDTTGNGIGTPSDGGSDWIIYDGEFDILNNQAVVTDITSGVSNAVLECGDSNGKIEFLLVNPESKRIGATFRSGTYTDLAGDRKFGSYHVLFKYASPGQITGTLYQQDENATTIVATTDAYISDNTVLTIELDGPDITIYLDGTKAIDYNSNFLYDQTEHGLCADQGEIGGLFDSFTFNATFSPIEPPDPTEPPPTGPLVPFPPPPITVPSPPLVIHRGTPSLQGFFLKNGFKALYAFGHNQQIKLWEKIVTPPGIDGGPVVRLGSLYNEKYQMFAPPDLITVSDGQMIVAYDPAVIDDIVKQVNIPDIITVMFPNGDRWSFDGCLRRFVPNEMIDGMQPVALVTVTALSNDPRHKPSASRQTPESGIGFTKMIGS